MEDETRIPLAERSEIGDREKEILDKLRGRHGRDINVAMTIVHHPTLFRRWVALIDAFTNESTLPPRNRELLILRTAWNCKSAYEWSRHAGPRKDCLSELEVKNIPAGPTAESWSKLDATLLTAADELHDQSRLSADTWSNLAQHFTQQQLIELVMLVGAYHLVAFSTNSFGVALDEGLSGLPNL